MVDVLRVLLYVELCWMDKCDDSRREVDSTER